MQHLEPDQLRLLAERLDTLRATHSARLGDQDVAWIRAYVAEWSADLDEGFAQMEAAWSPWALARGIARYTRGRIKEFFEAHNILHGQYDRFPELPELHSARYRWESSIDEEAWKAEHNGLHHGSTNIVGKDPDLSHGWLRTHPGIPWHPWHLLQVPTYALYYLGFTYLFNAQNYGLIDSMRKRRFPGGNEGYAVVGTRVRKGRRLRDLAAYDRRLVAEFWRRKFLEPARESSAWTLKLLLGFVLSELILNVWVAMTIQPTHQAEPKYPAGYRVSGRGEWYLRQIESARNFALGDPELLKLYGALNYQIEHHLFPDLPAWRYPAVAGGVREVCEELGIPYKADAHRWQTFARFVGVVLRHSFPSRTARSARPAKVANAEAV